MINIPRPRRPVRRLCGPLLHVERDRLSASDPTATRRANDTPTLDFPMLALLRFMTLAGPLSLPSARMTWRYFPSKMLLGVCIQVHNRVVGLRWNVFCQRIDTQLIIGEQQNKAFRPTCLGLLRTLQGCPADDHSVLVADVDLLLHAALPFAPEPPSRIALPHSRYSEILQPRTR